MNGYIKLYRKSIESAVFQNPNLWQVWCYCLMKANHKEKKILWNKKEVILNKGQFITGRFKGAEDCKMNPNTFYRQLKTLEGLDNISINSNNKNSIITIVNWASYQSKNENDNNKITTEEQQSNTDKNDKKIIIELAFQLVESIKKESSVYSIVYKYDKTLGEDELIRILTGLVNRGNKFDNENKLAAYLQTCTKSNGKITDSLPLISGDKEGWMDG